MFSSGKKFTKHNLYNLLQTITPFNHLDDRVLKDIISEAEIAHYPAGSYIFRQGEPSQNTLYLILEGQAKAVAAVGTEETVTAIRNRGDFFGVTGLLSDEPYPVSMAASEDLVCLLIKQTTFHKAVSSSDEFASYFTEGLASRLKELYQTIASREQAAHILEQNTLRQKIKDVAVKNVVTCLPEDNICDVAKKMSEAGVSSVVVVGLSNQPAGIITEKDMVAKILCADRPELELKAQQIMTPDLITVHPEDFAYTALLVMMKNKIKHVLVTDEHETLCGIVTVKDLVMSGKSGALSIVKQVEYQEDFDGLAQMISEVDRLKQALLNERAYASEICALTSELYDRITRKLVLLAEKEMIKKGLGPPPLDYCFINMGSAGRKEQFLRTDQDNGIIYADPPEHTEEAASSYFLELGRIIVEQLENCGFQRCRGKVMADNTAWCRPLSAWKMSLDSWVNRLDPDHIRNMTIFLDFRYVIGNEELHNNLKEYTTRLFQEAFHALLFMAEDDLRHRAPLTMFGRFITDRTDRQRRRIDLKKAVMVHMVDGFRLFSLREGIRETNSFERLHRLRERGVFKADDAEYFEAAYESLMMFRIRSALEKMMLGQEPDNFIDLDQLTKKEKSLLKESLLMVNRLQSLAAHAFHAHQS